MRGGEDAGAVKLRPSSSSPSPSAVEEDGPGEPPAQVAEMWEGLDGRGETVLLEGVVGVARGGPGVDGAGREVLEPHQGARLVGQIREGDWTLVLLGGRGGGGGCGRLAVQREASSRHSVWLRARVPLEERVAILAADASLGLTVCRGLGVEGTHSQNLAVDAGRQTPLPHVQEVPGRGRGGQLEGPRTLLGHRRGPPGSLGLLPSQQRRVPMVGWRAVTTEGLLE